MPRSLLARVLGFFLALTTGFATPASALAHGHAHEHEAEAHAAPEPVDEHRATSAHDHRDASRPATRTVASADRDTGEHPHASVDAALTTKTAAALAVLVAAAVVLPAARVVLVTPPLPERTLQFRVEAAHAPPPRLRAPPSLLG